MVHGFHLIEVWHRHSVEDGTNCVGSHHFYKCAAGIRMLLCFLCILVRSHMISLFLWLKQGFKYALLLHSLFEN